MKLIKGISLWILMILMAITTPIWYLFGYVITVEANRKRNK
jgi:hypothetical protein